MIEPTSSANLSEYVRLSSHLIKSEKDVIEVKRDDELFFYYTRYGNLDKLLSDFLADRGIGGSSVTREVVKEVKRVKIEVASELDGRELTQAEQTLLKVRERFNFFKNMGDSEVLSVTRDVGMMRLNKGEVLFRQGSDGDQVFFVIRGIVSIQIAKSKTERMEVAKLHAGAVFGEMSPVTKEKRSATVMCVEDGTTLLTFRLAESLEDSAMAYAKMYQNFTFILAEKIVNQNKLLITGNR